MPAEFRALMPFGSALHREKALAAFRVVLSLAFLALFRFIVPLAGVQQWAAHLLLVAYAIFSALVFAHIFISKNVRSHFLFLVHLSDVCWPSLICLLTGCSNSPFFLLYVFTLLAAPYRRRSLETILIAAGSIAIVVLEDLLATAAPFAWIHLLNQPLRLDSFAIKAAILLLLAGFLAYTAYWNQREQQAFATRSILRRLRSNAAFQNHLREVLPALLDIFEARKVVLVLRNSSTWRVFQWGAPGPGEDLPTCRNVPPSEEEQFFWPMPACAWSAACSKRRGRHQWLALNRNGCVIPGNLSTVPAELLWEHPYQTLMATSLQYGSEWSGRLFLVDPSCAAGREVTLRLLHQVADEVGPAVYNFYLWRHTSMRVRAVERQRIARDLHDGVVQSLIATELHLEVLRRQNSRNQESPEVSRALQEAQDSIRNEVRKLRNEIERLRSSATPRRVVPCLEDMLKTFQQETGIATTFSCNVQQESIPRNVSNEMIRILEEALSNVRRHSGARTVEVCLSSHGDRWEIVIQDDGRGFGFSGRLSLAELESARMGPRVIRERVHSINGDLALESWPNRGARVEISFASSW